MTMALALKNRKVSENMVLDFIVVMGSSKR